MRLAAMWFDACTTVPMDVLLRSGAMMPRRRVIARAIVTRTTRSGTALGSARAAGPRAAFGPTARSPRTALSTPTRAAISAGSTRAALSRTRRTSHLQGLLLPRRQDLIELGLGLLFERGNLLLLIRREVQPLDDETWQHVESATRPTGTTWAARSISVWRGAGALIARATLIAGAAGAITTRTAGRAILGGSPQGDGGNRDDADD